MKMLTRRSQNEIFKRLVDIVIELRRRPGDTARYAIEDVSHIAWLVGGPEMKNALEVRNGKSNQNQ